MPKNRQKGGEYLDNRIDKHVDDLGGVFTDPILVFPGGWGDTLPEWLKNAITVEWIQYPPRLQVWSRRLSGCLHQPTPPAGVPLAPASYPQR